MATNMALFARPKAPGGLKKYIVTIHGENYLISNGDAPVVYGYHATRQVEAADVDAAFDAAAAKIHKELDGKVLNAPGDAPLMRLHEINEVKSFNDCHIMAAGFKWYRDNGSERLENA